MFTGFYMGLFVWMVNDFPENLLSAHWHTSSEHRTETALLLLGALYSTEHLLSVKIKWQLRASRIKKTSLKRVLRNSVLFVFMLVSNGFGNFYNNFKKSFNVLMFKITQLKSKYKLSSFYTHTISYVKEKHMYNCLFLLHFFFIIISGEFYHLGFFILKG